MTNLMFPLIDFDGEEAVADLDEATLDCFRAAASGDDAENRFFASTHDALVDAGHYVCNVPMDLGGGGFDLVRTAHRQRELARYAPAPALASSMHLYWTGAAADMRRAGLDDLAGVLCHAAAGEIFASGHAESGCDIPVLLSTTSAVPVDGGYRISGLKHFGSLGPVWDQMGVHAMDVSDPARPMVVHGFVRRDDEGVSVIENWDTITMRASQSHDTRLDDVFVPADRIAAVVPAGSTDAPFTGMTLVWAVTLISNVYLGVAERAFELAVIAANSKTSIGMEGRTMANNPMVQHQIAEMWITLDGARASLDDLAGDWVAGADHGPLWGPKTFASKLRTGRAVRSVLDTAADVIGGSSIRSDAEIARLWRDARGIAFHPANEAFAHEAIGKGMLGIDPSGPRW